jgi:hypothetical protein
MPFDRRVTSSYRSWTYERIHKIEHAKLVLHTQMHTIHLDREDNIDSSYDSIRFPTTTSLLHVWSPLSTYTYPSIRGVFQVSIATCLAIRATLEAMSTTGGSGFHWHYHSRACMYSVYVGNIQTPMPRSWINRTS